MSFVLSGLFGFTVAMALGAQVRGPLSGWELAGSAPYPAYPQDAAPAPLADPAPAPGGTGGYALLERQDDGSGRPVRWDPCRPIHYVIRSQGAPPGGEAAIRSSIELLQERTGLRFAFDGYTSEVPVQDRPTVQPERYGHRWAPVLVAWTDPAEYPAMASYAGLGGPDAISGRVPGRRRYVSGVVLLNREYLDQAVTWTGGDQRLRAVVLHEFGHLAGLDHVDDPAQLMHPQPTAHHGGFAAGDRRGLAALSGGPCYRDF